MSGISSGGPDNGEPEESCESLVIDTQLSSPKPDVISGVQVGDVLEVDAEIRGDRTLVIVRHHGEEAGGLASPLLKRLRQCIEGGTQYRAKVTAKKDGQVRVRVSAIRL
jgi:hypothetical protein